jgi:hypothetical protein
LGPSYRRAAPAYEDEAVLVLFVVHTIRECSEGVETLHIISARPTTSGGKRNMAELSEQQKKDIEYLRTVRDEDIDLSDMPEITDFTGFVMGPMSEHLKRRRERLEAQAPNQEFGEAFHALSRLKG